jgi:predicted ATPase/DNA-binding CsgD family transcriptional regulator
MLTGPGGKDVGSTIGAPPQLTALVGRDQDLADLTRLLSRTRLLTLSGAGGVGKTRLALAAADELGGTFTDGAVFVDLAPIVGAQSVVPTIARTLGIRDDGDMPLIDRLANALRDREMLLILDNFEHVLEAANSILELLQVAPRVTVLVTSRAPLRVRGEREYPVAPLACPDAAMSSEIDSAETLLRYPALELFVSRAQDVRPDFQLDRANTASIVNICRRLDGLPLALELAAARIRVLPPDALLGRLGDGLSLLTGGPRDLPARQQTIRATIAWSYELLNPSEQKAFRRLSVFAGDFSLDAAIVISGTDLAQPALDLIASLNEKNLLRRTEDVSDRARFRMLETVREFGHEQLEAFGELEEIHRAHAEFFVALVEEAAPHLWRADREEWMQRVDADMDDLRLAVDWSTTGTDSGRSLVRIARVLGFVYWRIRGNLHEGMRWSELALQYCTADEDTERRAALLWQSGGVAGYMGMLAPARTWLEESVRLARPRGGTDLAYALVLQGFVESHFGEPATVSHLNEGLSILRTRGDTADLAMALAVAITPYAVVGDSPASLAALSECLAVAGELGDDWLVGVALSSASFLEVRGRDWPAARLHMEQALEIFSRHSDEGSILIIYNNLGVVAREQGDDAHAVEYLQRSLTMARRLGVDDAITRSHLSEFALRRGDTRLSAQHIQEALRSASRSGDLRSIMISLMRSARLASTLEQPAVAARVLGGLYAMSEKAGPGAVPELAAEMGRVADRARSALGESDFASAVTHGQTTEPQALLTETLAWVTSLRFDGAPSDLDTPAWRTDPRLSAREIEVLRLIAGGKTNREIADALVISPNTVARHISNIFDKLGVANRTEAAASAHRHGLAAQLQ